MSCRAAATSAARSSIDSALAFDHPQQAIRIAGDLSVAHLRRELHCGVGGCARAIEVAARDPHLHDVHFDLHTQADVSKVAHELDGFAIRQLGLVPPLGVGVHHAEVVERDADVAHETHGTVVGETRLIELQRSREIAADVGDDTEVLGGDRRELGVPSADCALARVVVEPNGLVELTLLPSEHAEHVDRVADGEAIVPRLGGRDRGSHAIFGRGVIRVGEMAAGDPAKERCCGGKLIAARE